MICFVKSGKLGKILIVFFVWLIIVLFGCYSGVKTQSLTADACYAISGGDWRTYLSTGEGLNVNGWDELSNGNSYQLNDPETKNSIRPTGSANQRLNSDRYKGGLTAVSAGQDTTNITCNTSFDDFYVSGKLYVNHGGVGVLAGITGADKRSGDSYIRATATGIEFMMYPGLGVGGNGNPIDLQMTSKVRIKEGSNLYKAIRDPKLDVYVQAFASFAMIGNKWKEEGGGEKDYKSSAADFCSMILSWAPDGGSNGQALGSASSISNANTSIKSGIVMGTGTAGEVGDPVGSDILKLNSVTSASYLELSFTNFYYGRELRSPSGAQSDPANDYQGEGIGARLTDVYIAVRVAIAEGMSFENVQSDYSGDGNIPDMVIFGENRDYENCEVNTAKPGDLIVVRSRVEMPGGGYADFSDAGTNGYFSDYYLGRETLKTYNSSGQLVSAHSVVDWVKQEGSGIGDVGPLTQVFNDENGYLTLMYDMLYANVDESQRPDRLYDVEGKGVFDFLGEVAVFVVNGAGEVSNAYVYDNALISLRPRLWFYNVNSQTEDGLKGVLEEMSRSFEIRIDGQKPEMPSISEDSNLYANYIAIDKYYTSDLKESGTTTTGEVCGRGIYVGVTLSSDTLALCSALRTEQSVYYTTDNSTPSNDTVNTTSKKLERITSAYSNQPNKNYILFLPLPAPLKIKTFTLRMVTYDDAGLKSSVSVPRTIKIDVTDYYVNIYFSTGGTQALYNARTHRAIGSALQGKVTGSSIRYNAVATATYKRGDFVNIRIQMTESAFESYKLEKFYNYSQEFRVPNVATTDFTFENGYYAIYAPIVDTQDGFEINDRAVANGASYLTFVFFFKSKVTILTGAEEVVYNGAPQGIEQPTIAGKSGVEIVTRYRDSENGIWQDDKYTSAGNYFYWCTVDSTNYFGDKYGSFTIKKATPNIVDLEIEDNLTYPQNMESAVIKCKNIRLGEPGASTSAYFSDCSSDGLLNGSFRITNPISTSDQFLRPNVGEYAVTVTFFPEDEGTLNSETGYHNGNFANLELSANLIINHNTDIIITLVNAAEANRLNISNNTTRYFDTFNHVYDGTRKEAYAVTNPAEQPLLYYYKQAGANDDTYTSSKPTNAGIYDVKIVVDEANCNYSRTLSTTMTEEVDFKFIIEKMSLIVEAEESDCFYQFETPPISRATTVGGTYPPVAYSYRYKDFYDSNSIWSSTIPTEVGEYSVEVNVEAPNYKGTTISKLRIRQGNYNSANFSVVYPAAIPTSYSSGLGHITYNQSLDKIKLTTSSGYTAKYSFKGTDGSYSIRPVPGKFIIASERYDEAVETLDTYIQRMGDTLLETGSYEDDNQLYRVYIPDDLKNFTLAYSSITIYVVKAVPSFALVSHAELTYGLSNRNAKLSINDSQGKGEFTYPDGGSDIINISGYASIDNGEIADNNENFLRIEGNYLLKSSAKVVTAAGRTTLEYDFTPKDTANIASTNIKITLIVNKAPVNIRIDKEKTLVTVDSYIDGTYVDEIEALTSFYGEVVERPATEVYYKETNQKAEGITCRYRYYDLEGNTVAMTSSTRAGIYRLSITTEHENYAGSYDSFFVVKKAIPTIISNPTPNVSVYYMMDMRSVSLSAGVARYNNLSISGKSSFIGVPVSPDRVGIVYYNVRFIPNDGENYAAVDIRLPVTVEKATTFIALDNLEHDYLDTYNIAPIYTTRIIKRNLGDSTVYKNLDDGVTTFNPDTDRYLNAKCVFSYTGLEKLPTDAGGYTLVATIFDDNYAGSCTATYVINKIEGKINVDITSEAQNYTGGSLALRATTEQVDSLGNSLGIDYVYYDNKGNKLSIVPYMVGTYTVRMSINDTNYYGSEEGTFTIRVTGVSFTNIRQEYSQVVQSRAVYSPASAVGILMYRRQVSVGVYEEYTENMPTLAGTYEISVIFAGDNNNGYSGVFTDMLTIDKTEATISAAAVIYHTYSNTQNSSLNASTRPYGLGVTKEYYYPRTGRFSTLEPYEVGTYAVRFSINDKNYEGSFTADYIIQKAAPVIISAPSISDMTYLDDKSTATFTGGMVLFGAVTLTGTYSMKTDTSILQVGAQEVTYVFKPLDTKNLLEIEGKARINIIKKDISDLIVFDDNFTAQYNGKSHSLSATTYIGEDVTIDMYYSNSKVLPISVGEYQVKAVVVDRNYEGSMVADRVYKIVPGEPKINLPTLKAININSSLRSSAIQLGYAYIDGSGDYEDGVLVEGTETRIPGTFSFDNPDLVMTKANYHDVMLVFTPTSGADFTTKRFYVSLRVIGTDSVVGTVGIVPTKGAVYYGQTLSEAFSLSRTGNGLTEGTLSFSEPMAIPEVGSKIAYQFHPDDDDYYNIMEGELDVQIEKTTARLVSVSAIAYVGDVIGMAFFESVMRNPYNGEVPVDGEFSIMSITQEDVGNAAPGLRNASIPLSTIITPDMYGKIYTAHYLFSSNNYSEFEGDVSLEIYYEVESRNILVSNTSKEYDGKAISASDMGIYIEGTEHLIDINDISVTIYRNGRTNAGIEVGSYTVRIEIRDEKYYGVTVVDYNIEKADVSSRISLSFDSTVFGESEVPTIVVNGLSNYSQNNFTIEYKKKSENALSYNMTFPTEAGEFDVRVKTTGTTFYSGTAVLDFTIEKKVLIITSSNMSQQYGRVNPPTFSIEHGLDGDVEVYYYAVRENGSTSNFSSVLPTDAGEYRAVFELQNTNYYAKAEITFRITQLELSLKAMPDLSHLTYGQYLSDVQIIGGFVVDPRDPEATETIAGSFYFENGESIRPDSDATRNTDGEAKPYLATLIFEPMNRNFASLRLYETEVFVAQANAQILFSGLNAVYTGKNLSQKVKYTILPDENIPVKIRFFQNGVVVNPIDAGSYSVEAKTLTNTELNSYKLSAETDYSLTAEQRAAIAKLENNYVGAAYATFVIKKVSMETYSLPYAVPIEYGQSLAYSSLNIQDNFGRVSYSGMDGFIDGTFTYVHPGLVLGDVGIYNGIQFLFTPTDSVNYNSFNGLIDVEVTKAKAVITVTNYTFVYGTTISSPTFTTSPAGLKVSHNISFLNGIADCGAYEFEAEVIDKNYEGTAFFNIIINKKQANMIFIDEGGNKVTKYNTSYSKLLNAKAVMDMTSIESRDVYTDGGLHINTYILVNYYEKDNMSVSYGHIPPSAVGSYMVVASADHKNYFGTTTIYYDIAKGTVEEVVFDTDTLEKQVYGTIIQPIITTRPIGVQYVIDYTGYAAMPTSAGTYNIIVRFIDENYYPKEVAAKFTILKRDVYLSDITVSNKVYDGVASLDVSAKLVGVTLGDEVYYALKARTYNQEVNTGLHKVEIFDYAINGLHSSNYNLLSPVYNGSIEIFSKNISDEKTGSFISNNLGFANGVSVEFKSVTNSQNQETFFTNLLGQDAATMTFTIKENGLATTLADKVKVYVKIPDEFLDKEFTVSGVGSLGDRQVNFIREGDYITFYTDSSGEVMFSTNEFSYWFIAFIGAILVLVIGIVLLVVLNPMTRRSNFESKEAKKLAVRHIRKGY